MQIPPTSSTHNKVQCTLLCRTEQEFGAERVEGAVNVPFMVRGDSGLVPNTKFAGRHSSTMFACSKIDIPRHHAFDRE